MKNKVQNAKHEISYEQIKGQKSQQLYKKTNAKYWLLRSRWPLDQAVGNLYGIDIHRELPKEFVPGDLEFGFEMVNLQEARLICIDAIKTGLIKCYTVSNPEEKHAYAMPFIFVDRVSFLSWAKLNGARVPPDFLPIKIDCLPSTDLNEVEISLDSIKALRNDQLEHFIGVLVAEHWGRQNKWDSNVNASHFRDSLLGAAVEEAFDWSSNTIRKKIQMVRPPEKPARRGGTRKK